MKKLHVPYNFEIDILKCYAEWADSIEDIYFPISSKILTSARPIVFPDDYEEQVHIILRWCKRYNIRAALLLNGAMDQLTDQEFNKLYSYLNKMVKEGLDVVVIANPYLIQWVHNHWPQLTIRLSVLSLINTKTKIIKAMSSLPVDEICLPPEMNRDLELLHFIKQTYPNLKVSILASEICRGSCPYYYWHQVSCNSSSIEWKGRTLQYEENKGQKNTIFSALQVPFILPSELDFYSQYVDGFKIEGRQYSTEFLSTLIPHYALQVDPEYFQTLIHAVCSDADKELRIPALNVQWLQYRKNCKMICLPSCPFYEYCCLGKYNKG